MLTLRYPTTPTAVLRFRLNSRTSKKFKHHAAIGNRQPKAERPRPLPDPAGMEGTDGVVDCKHVVCLCIHLSFVFAYMWLCEPKSACVEECLLSMVEEASHRGLVI
jgi:hypothetical protein